MSLGDCWCCSDWIALKKPRSSTFRSRLLGVGKPGRCSIHQNDQLRLYRVDSYRHAVDFILLDFDRHAFASNGPFLLYVRNHFFCNHLDILRPFYLDWFGNDGPFSSVFRWSLRRFLNNEWPTAYFPIEHCLFVSIVSRSCYCYQKHHFCNETFTLAWSFWALFLWEKI